MSPKKVLLDLVKKLNVARVVFDVTEPDHWMHVCHVVARNAKLAARAEDLRAALAAMPSVEQTLASIPADDQAGRSVAVKAHQDARVATLQALDQAAADATQYSIEIIRTFAERVGAFGGHWPVRIEMQHCNPRMTTSAYAESEEELRQAFAAIMHDKEILTLLDHVAGHETE